MERKKQTNGTVHQKTSKMVVDHIDNCLFTAFSTQQHFLSESKKGKLNLHSTKKKNKGNLKVYAHVREKGEGQDSRMRKLKTLKEKEETP